ncbi:MAG TPA: cytochrome c peroxidase [Kofleriaceae bacterium]|nr:cytochrome c peroxidase [Kofleriaceae bacterium]
MRPVVLAALFAVFACGRKPVTKEELGRRVFEDPELSSPAGQGCVDCHVAKVAFADPEDDRTSAGVIKDRFGTRNTQAITYAKFAPPLHEAGGRMVGGLFWDGRANTLEAQVLHPFTNPLEMNNASKEEVIAKVKRRHGAAFTQVFGKGALDGDVDEAMLRVGEALAAFERTERFAPFSSKYDLVVAGKLPFSDTEARGSALFGKHCASCHPPPLFTNWTYLNLGVPRFNDNPFYLLPPELNPDGERHIDHGLAKTTGDARHDGMFRVPSLRNVARTTPYGHNGYFRRLDEMIAFHGPTKLAPEVPHTVDRSGLAGFVPSKEDIRDLVAFLKTLTDAGIEGANVAAAR